jgi:twitching motility two-component system response regulator PilG
MSIESSSRRSWIDSEKRHEAPPSASRASRPAERDEGTLVQAAVAAATKGDRGHARSLLLQASQLEPESEAVWLWLAHLAASPSDRNYYLRQVLRCDPSNEQARAGLAAILLEEGIAFARNGARENARARLEELLVIEPLSEAGWLWLASVGANRAVQRRCLNRVLEINPAHRQARALLQRPEFQAEPRSTGWRCPMCSFRAAAAPEICAGCGLVISLVDPDRILTNSRLNRGLVEAGARRYQQQLATAPGFEVHLHLGLAYLNLRQVPEGLDQLRTASLLRPQDEILRSQIEILDLWWARLEEGRMAESAILVVDDSPTVHKLVQSILQPSGFQVVVATDGVEGLSRLKELRPVLILLDITMPGMDGYQVCKVIKANPATADIPVVMLTGRDGLIDKVRAKMAGSTVYVTKPFSRASLQQVVDKLLGPRDQGADGRKEASSQWRNARSS